MSHICIVIARFYEDIADELVRGAVEALGADGSTYEVVEVPGAFEIPAAVRMAVASGKYGGYVALGCVIRGETTHYDYVCGESARGLNHLAVEFVAPVGYGILTVEDSAQAWARAAVAQGNKGRDAALACLRMLAIKEQMTKAHG
jgi:6,7-dimethyl-8-ribityllumazine synthase